MNRFKSYYNSLILSLSCLVFCDCSNRSYFVAEGVVAGANGQTIFLENNALNGVAVIDSAKLKPEGSFRFAVPRPQFPEFYRLRLNNQLIQFAIDSTETVVFTADAHNFSTSYSVEGSENSKAFKEITLAQLDADHEIRKLRDSYGMNLIPDTTYQASVISAVKSYKETVKKYIFGAPASPAAYFALFQQIDGLWIFDLYDRADSKAYGAVATNYKLHYPESPRAKHLEMLALQSMKIIRGERQAKLNLPEGVAKEVKYIDIELPDVNGKPIKLSEVTHGKAVLLNFTEYQTDWSAAFNITLGDLFNKYKDKGLQIYQVSLDNDAHFWKNAAYNIPWVSVRDPQSVYSSVAAIYNVRQLPAIFIINKKGELCKRVESVETLENDIRAAL